MIHRDLAALSAMSMAVLGAALASCSAPAVPPPVHILATPPVPPAPPQVDHDFVSATSVRAPKAPAVDGDLAEWESLVPVARLLAPGAKRPQQEEMYLEEGQPLPPEELPVLPRELLEAESRLGVAVTGVGVLVAADIAAAAGDIEGVWLGLGAVPAPPPPIGSPTHFGSRFEPLFCPDFVQQLCDGYSCDSDEPTPPAEMAACKAHLARREAWKKAQERRFKKVVLLGREGVSLLDPAGQLVPLEGARPAWKKTEKGTTVEVSLPISVMPRVAEAPLATLVLSARVARSAAAAAPAQVVDNGYSTNLPEGVSFEPHGDLRAALWARVNTGPSDIQSPSTGTPFRPCTGLSYQPGSGLTIESMTPDEEEVQIATYEMLGQKLGALGDVEVRWARASRDFMAIFKAGKLTEVIDAELGEPMGVVEREGELHVFTVTRKPHSFGWYQNLPRWSVRVVSANGKSREALPDADDEFATGGCHHLENQEEIVSRKKLDTFGFRVDCLDILNQGQPIEISYRWDKAKKSYGPSVWQPRKVKAGKPKKD